MARPSRINATITRLDGTESTVGATIVDAVRQGAPRDQAAQAAGIGERTLYRWLQVGQDVDPETNDIDELTYLQFWQSLQKADGEATIEHLGIISDAARNGTWQAAAWWLERRYPQQFARRTRLDPDDAPDEDAPVTEEVAARFLKYVEDRADH